MCAEAVYSPPAPRATPLRIQAIFSQPALAPTTRASVPAPATSPAMSPAAPLARSPIPASCATIGQILRQSHRAPALPPARRPPRQESAAAMPIPAALLITIPTISISMPALAHAGGGAAEDLGNIWLAWNFDPLLALGTAAFVALYFYALGPLRRRYGWAESVDRGQVA